MRTAFATRSVSGLSLVLLSLLGCNGVIEGNVGQSTNVAASPGGAGMAIGGGGMSAVDAPTQPLADLKCETRYAPDGRVWRLSPEQYAASIADAFGVMPDISAMPKDGINQYTGFATGSADNYVTVGFADVVWDAGAAAAQKKAELLMAERACLGNSPDDACIGGVLTDVAARAFRRPLSEAETQRYKQFFQQQASAFGMLPALRMLLQAVANAPELLYRTELGTGEKGHVTLTDQELASELSFMLADAPPTDELRQAALAGKLSDRATVESFAKSLLASPGAKNKLDQFVNQYLQLSGLDEKVADAGLADSMVKSAQAFFVDLSLESRGTLQDFLTAPRAYVDAKLAPLYGVSTTSQQLSRVELDPTERGGILTQLAFLSTKAGPIHRGRLIKEGFLCGEIPAPPPGASLQKAKLAGPDPDATEQQRWLAFKDQQPCGGCHALFQPFGIAFDNYDELGRYRQVNAAGRRIDASGSVGDLQFADGLTLGQEIANSATGQYCFAKRYMSFALGRDVSSGRDACAIKAVGDRLVQSGLVLSELFLALTQDDSFYERTNVE